MGVQAFVLPFLLLLSTISENRNWTDAQKSAVIDGVAAAWRGRILSSRVTEGMTMDEVSAILGRTGYQGSCFTGGNGWIDWWYPRLGMSIIFRSGEDRVFRVGSRSFWTNQLPEKKEPRDAFNFILGLRLPASHEAAAGLEPGEHVLADLWRGRRYSIMGAKVGE